MSNDVYARAAKRIASPRAPLSAVIALRDVGAERSHEERYRAAFPELFDPYAAVPLRFKELRDLRVLALLFMSAAGGDL